MWYGGERIINGSYTPGNIITIIGLALLGGSTVGQVWQLIPRFCLGETADDVQDRIIVIVTITPFSLASGSDDEVGQEVK